MTIWIPRPFDVGAKPGFKGKKTLNIDEIELALSTGEC
jgi:hypothetical protein